MKSGFSPWRTKQNFNDSQHEDQIYADYTQQNTISFKRSNKINSHITIQNMVHKRPNSNMTFKNYQNKNLLLNNKTTQQLNFRFATLQKKRSSISSQRCINQQSKNSKNFQNQKWKTLSHHSKDAFNQEYAKIKRERYNITKYKAKQYNESQCQKQKQSRVILQQVAVKNFVIHGSYENQSNQSIFNIKKKESSFILKQKFAELRKSINVIKNKENVFKVIKLQRKMNTAIKEAIIDKIKIR